MIPLTYAETARLLRQLAITLKSEPTPELVDDNA
jgi:hypothetical protein